MTYKILPVLALILLSQIGFAQQIGGYRSSISKEFRKEEPNQTQGFEILNRSIQNHAIASSLASNAGEINRNVESLMESLFYSLMDKTAKTRLSDTLSGNASYERDVQPTGIGSYVVIDRFRIGPEILKDLGRIKALPLTFRNQNKLFVTNVSYRSDALRKANSQSASGWRELANNWFGALPFLTSILPPSFNPEELYDPISYLGTPFLFPKNAEQALQMPLGTVRSYGLNGSSGISVDTAGKVVKDAQKHLSLADLQSTIPISGFVEGEHQISILHTRDNEVWLAVSEIRQIGGVLDVSLGNRYKILQNLFKWWNGSIATIAPIDFELEKAKILQRDELYTFDLDKKDAREALNKALNGDISMAKSNSMQAAQADESGVHFQFRRLSTRDEDTSKNARSFFVLQSQKRDRINDGENTLTDGKGEYITLEAEHAIQDRDWNVLTGAQTVDVNFRYSLPVLKKVQDRKTFYKIVETPDPNYFIANLKIIDSFHDSRDYKEATRLLRKFSHLPLTGMPAIETYAKDLGQKLIRDQAFVNPTETTFQKDVSATHLGRYEAYAHVYISQDTLKNIGRLESSAFWKAYAQSFGLDSNYWAKEAVDRGSPFYFNWFSSYALMPFRLINLDTGFSDYAYEGQRIRSALERIASSTEPADIINSYRTLMDTKHPAELLYTLSELSPVEVPAIVGLTTSPASDRDDTPDTKTAKKDFAKLNGKKFQSTVAIPDLKRNQSAEEKLAVFTPGGFKDPKINPQLRQITLAVRQTPPDPTPRLSATVELSGTGLGRENLQSYIRVEQNGPISIGRFVLGEEIRELKFVKRLSNEGDPRSVYEFDLNGQNGLKKSDFFDDALHKAGAFDLYFSISGQEDTWGPEQKFSFDVQNGLIRDL